MNTNTPTTESLMTGVQVALPLIASLFGFWRARLLRKSGGNHTPFRWAIVALGFGAIATFFATVTTISHIESSDDGRSVCIVGQVARLTVSDNQAVAHVKDPTGEVAILFTSPFPKEGDYVLLHGVVGLTPETRTPYIKSNEGAWTLSLLRATSPKSRVTTTILQ